MRLRPNNLSFRQLRAFREVAQTGAFNHAARRLSITTSALSESIAQLEETLGVRLFERTTRSVALSDAGAGFLVDVEAILERLDDSLIRVADISTLRRGRIAVAGAPSALAAIVMPCVARLRPGPDLQVTLIDDGEQGLLRRVRAGEVDFAIGAATAEDEEIMVTPLVRERFGVVLMKGDPLLRKRRLSLAHFADRPCVTLTRDTAITRILQSVAELPARARQGDITASNPGLQRMLIEALNGYALLPAIVALHPVFAGTTFRLLEDLATVRLLAVFRRRRREPSPLAAALLTGMRAEAARLVRQPGGGILSGPTPGGEEEGLVAQATGDRTGARR